MFDEFGDPIDTGGDVGSDPFTDTGDGGSGGMDLSGGFGFVRTALTPRIPGGAGQRGYNFGFGAGRALGRISTALGMISVKKAWEITKRFGPDVAAGVVGMSVVDLMQVFAHSPGLMIGTRRRRRGISSRDIRTTRRVVRFTQRMISDIGCVHHARSFPARRRHAAH